MPRIVSEFTEVYTFLCRLIKELFCHRGKPVSQLKRAAIVTRADLFPTNHGGAVKIVQTARYLSFHYDEVLLITQSCTTYYVYRKGKLEEQSYPFFARVAFARPYAWLRSKIEASGFPRDDSWMVLPAFDWNFRFRVFFLGIRHPFEVMHAEVAPFIFACDWLSRFYPELPRIVVMQNVEFLRIGKTYNLSADDIKKMKHCEMSACRASDCVVAVSEEDKALLIEHGLDASRIAIIPSGVDLAEYTGTAPETARDMRARYGLRQDDYVIMFHGVLCYKPNLEAVRLINQEIMPRLRSMGCPAKCLVVGLYPPTEYAADDIIMTGAVDRLAPYIQTADVAIVPLLDGGGTRLKILEYFAAGVPVISTAKGAEGIKAEQGKDILIEDSMDGIAALVRELQHDVTRRGIIGANGKTFVQQFGWDRLAEDYCSLYRETAAMKQTGAP
jgi:glycosyltransferase involved in cell wall biosynthesis